MLSTRSRVKSTLLCGPAELSRSFLFEAAIFWGEEGRRVIYIAPEPLKSLPSACHERHNPAPAPFRLMRFMYLPDSKSLVEQLVILHTYAVLPSVLLIDELDNYLNDESAKGERRMHIARVCAVILDAMNACSRILKTTVHVCAASSSALSDNGMHTIYFRNIWDVTEEENEKAILLRRSQGLSQNGRFFKYHRFKDGNRVLKQILQEFAG